MRRLETWFQLAVNVYLDKFAFIMPVVIIIVTGVIIFGCIATALERLEKRRWKSKSNVRN